MDDIPRVDVGSTVHHACAWKHGRYVAATNACQRFSSAPLSYKNIVHPTTTGAVIFIGMAWALGWVYIWTQKPGYDAIDTSIRMHSLPPEGGIMLKLKAFTVAYECYV